MLSYKNSREVAEVSYGGEGGGEKNEGTPALKSS